ncbi:MAG: RNA polymerase sigma factor [Planctomycetota bacterium]
MQRRNQPAQQASVAPIWSALDEGELVRRARSESGAFGELYRRHYDAIGAYLIRRVGCRHSAEDLLSEVFVSAMSALPRFRDRGIPYRHYLYRIATRAANRWSTRLRRHPRPLDVSALVDPRSEGAEAGDAERVVQAMHMLRPKHQEVLALHYVEGLSVDEVARILRVRPGTVKSRLKRGRDTLRARLGSKS